MFYKIGFFVLLAVVIAGAWVFVRANPMKNEGAASWIDFYSESPEETVKFLSDNFGIRYEKYKEPTSIGTEYIVLRAARQLWPFAGLMPFLSDNRALRHAGQGGSLF